MKTLTRNREPDQQTTDEPDRLPTGVTLPDGTYLAFPPERDCGCADCLAAFEAHRAGTLRIPKESELPW